MNKYLLIFCLFLIPFIGHSQYLPVGSPIISHFEKSDYHAGTQNWAIIQDDRGIMYFGNNKGILEFDGTKWRTFHLPNYTIVRSLALATNEKLYVGGQDELGYLSADESGNLSYHSLTSLIPKAFKSFSDVWKIFVLGEEVYFCSQRAVFVLRDNQIQVISPDDRFENFFESRGRLYIQDVSEGLLIWEKGQLTPVSGGDQLTDSRISAILPFKGQQELIVTASQGLFLANEQGIQSWQIQASSFLENNETYSAIKLADGRIAIGTTQNGLLIINEEGRPVMHLSQANGLQNNTVLCIFQDKHSNLWLGLDNGIDYVESSAPFSLISREVGVEGTGYVSIIHDNKLYLGTNQGLYYLDWPKNENPLVGGGFQKIEALSGQVWSLNKLGEDLIVGMHSGAYQIKNDQVFSLSSPVGAWKFIQLDSNPNYAIEGCYGGLFLYEKKEETQIGAGWKLLGKIAGFDESARVIEEDANGHLWISHAYKGLYRISIDIENKKVQSVDFYNTENGLPSDLKINVAKIRNELIFTSPKGVYSYDEENDQFRLHETMNEVFGESTNIHRLLEDQNRNIWFSVDQDFGLLKIEEQGIFNQINKVYFNQLQEKIMSGFEHVYAHDKHNVFIATENGFIHYDPTSSKDFLLPFQTIIRTVTSIVDRDSIIFGGGAPGQSLASKEDNNFLFPNKFNDFRFSFSTPFYEQINHVEYRYRLEGFNDNWSNWSTITEKEYTNLPRGDYRFLVEARNAYAQTSISDSFAFSIKPPWANTVIARIVFALFALGMLIALYRFSTRHSRIQQEELKAKQAQQLQQQEVEFKKEVEKSEAEIIRLRNEKLVTEISHKDSQLASATMHLVQKGEMLNTVKQELNKLLTNTTPENRKQVKKLIRRIVEDARIDDNWEQFEFHFDQVHENFLRRLREQYPMLTPKDHKICAYLRMNLSTKEIAPLMNISVRGVEISRYRLRKKLNLDQDVNLVDFMLKL